jgi:hypothetical protein
VSVHLSTFQFTHSHVASCGYAGHMQGYMRVSHTQSLHKHLLYLCFRIGTSASPSQLLERRTPATSVLSIRVTDAPRMNEVSLLTHSLTLAPRARSPPSPSPLPQERVSPPSFFSPPPCPPRCHPPLHQMQVGEGLLAVALVTHTCCHCCLCDNNV